MNNNRIIEEFCPLFIRRIMNKDGFSQFICKSLIWLSCILRFTSPKKLFYNEVVKAANKNPEIKKFFPDSKLSGHYVYTNTRNTIENPDLLINQIRFYRLYNYFKENYPDILGPGTEVLDVGDTSGILFEALGRRGTSLNINKECVDFINRKGLKAVRGDAENIDFNDKSFDYSFCFQCLEHLPNPLRALNEMGRITKKTVFISIPYTRETKIYNVNFWVEAEKSSWKEKSVRDVDCHVFEFSTEDLKNLLTYTNLEYVNNFKIDYFDNSTLKGRILNRGFGSYFNFFVLKPSEKQKLF